MSVLKPTFSNDQGHLYWKWRAIIQDEFGNAHEDACKAYERAMS